MAVIYRKIIDMIHEKESGSSKSQRSNPEPAISPRHQVKAFQGTLPSQPIQVTLTLVPYMVVSHFVQVHCVYLQQTSYENNIVVTLHPSINYSSLRVYFTQHL